MSDRTGGKGWKPSGSQEHLLGRLERGAYLEKPRAGSTARWAISDGSQDERFTDATVEPLRRARLLVTIYVGSGAEYPDGVVNGSRDEVQVLVHRDRARAALERPRVRPGDDVPDELRPPSVEPAKPKGPRCARCETRRARYRVTATDLEGTVLDSEEVCRDCAGEAGFTLGGG